MTSQNNSSDGEEEETGDYQTGAAWARGPLVLAFVALAAGLLSVLFLAQPNSPGESSVEVGFARDMAVHHAQATDMAETVRRNTQDENIYALASEIVIIQQLQIGQIRGWLGNWDLPEEGNDLPMTWMGHPTSGPMPGMASSEQISRLASLPQAEMEIEFLRLMIPHHQAGVEMAQAILDRTRRPEVRKLAQDILAGQAPEIMFMQDLLIQRGQPRMPDSLPIAGMESGSETAHHGGSTSSGGDPKAGAVARKTLQFAPWTIAVFALAWLVLRAPIWEQFDEGLPGSIMLAVAAVALLVGAAIQAGFVVGQLPVYTSYALVASVAGAVAAAVVLAAPSVRISYLTGLAISLALVASYVGLRILVPLESGAAEGSSLAGIASSFFYLIALAVSILLWLMNRDFEGEDEPVN